MFHKIVIYSSLSLLTLLCTFSAVYAFNSRVTLCKRVFDGPKDSVEVQLFSGPNATLYDALVEAARVDDKFKYTGKRYSSAYYVDSIAGLAEDSNRSLFWFVYKKTPNGVELWQRDLLATFVADNEHYLFWYKNENDSRESDDDVKDSDNSVKEIDSSESKVTAPLYKRIWRVLQTIYEYIRSRVK